MIFCIPVVSAILFPLSFLILASIVTSSPHVSVSSCGILLSERLSHLFSVPTVSFYRQGSGGPEECDCIKRTLGPGVRTRGPGSVLSCSVTGASGYASLNLRLYRLQDGLDQSKPSP